MALAAALLAASAAAAEEHAGGEYPISYIERPLALPAGMFQISAALLANLSSGSAFRPLFLSPGVAFGVDGKLQIGVSSNGLCINLGNLLENGHSIFGCPYAVNDFAVEADYDIVHQPGLDAAVQTAVLVNPINPTSLVELAAGIDLRMVQGKFAIRAGPKLAVGLNQRDIGNREFLRVPLDFILQVDKQLALSAGLDLNLLLDPPDPHSFGDFLTIPVRVGGLFAVNNKIDLGAVFGFDNLLGKGPGGVDYRSLGVFVNLRLP
jgi:hypothetical protein